MPTYQQSGRIKIDREKMNKFTRNQTMNLGKQIFIYLKNQGAPVDLEAFGSLKGYLLTKTFDPITGDTVYSWEKKCSSATIKKTR